MLTECILFQYRISTTQLTGLPIASNDNKVLSSKHPPWLWMWITPGQVPNSCFVIHNKRLNEILMFLLLSSFKQLNQIIMMFYLNRSESLYRSSVSWKNLSCTHLCRSWNNCSVPVVTSETKVSIPLSVHRFCRSQPTIFEKHLFHIGSTGRYCVWDNKR